MWWDVYRFIFNKITQHYFFFSNLFVCVYISFFFTGKLVVVVKQNRIFGRWQRDRRMLKAKSLEIFTCIMTVPAQPRYCKSDCTLQLIATFNWVYRKIWISFIYHLSCQKLYAIFMLFCFYYSRIQTKNSKPSQQYKLNLLENILYVLCDKINRKNNKIFSTEVDTINHNFKIGMECDNWLQCK